MLFPGTHIIEEGISIPLVTWSMAQVHLGLTTDEYKSSVCAMIDSATLWAELYCNRCLSERSIKIHYVAPMPGGVGVSDFLLRFYPDPDSITITATDTLGAETDITSYKLLPLYRQAIQLTTPDDWEIITIEYTARKYEQAQALIPAILMKVGEMFTLRQDGERPRMSAAVSIMNPHRLKYHI
jgi:hypothetical protein